MKCVHFCTSGQHFISSTHTSTYMLMICSLSLQLGYRLNDIALRGKPTSEQRDVTTYHMGSHSVVCFPTQVNAPCLTQARKAGTRFTYPKRDGRLSWPRCLVTYLDGLSTCRWSPSPSINRAWHRSLLTKSSYEQRITAKPGQHLCMNEGSFVACQSAV